MAPTADARVGYGRPVTLHGLLMSSAGLPIAGQPVAILTAPDNGSNAFTQAAAVTTGPDGSWTATLPPGPSRIIEASYPGSPTILPATGSATVITPAKIVLTSVTPDRTPWGSTVRITGRVLGGYIPASSKLLRLDLGIVGIPGLSKIQGIPNVAPGRDVHHDVQVRALPGRGALLATGVQPGRGGFSVLALRTPDGGS